MIVLSKGTSHKIRLTTDASADIEVHYTVVDKTGTGPSSYSYAAAGEPLASVTTATSTDIVVGAASTERSIRHLSFYNNHASTACTCTVFEEDGTDTVTHQKVVLAAGESLVLDAAGVWSHYDANGGPYVGTGPVATQAQMEAASDVTVFVSPGRLHFHPAVAKVWGLVGPATQLVATYNITSVADTAAGRCTVTIATDFSSASWCPVVGNVGGATVATAAAGWATALAAGSVEIDSSTLPATPALGDPTQYSFAGYGDL